MGHSADSTREALKRLKRHWVSTGGSNYLGHLSRFKEQLSPNHKSSPALLREIMFAERAQPAFEKWTKTKYALRLLDKNKQESAASN